MYIFLAFFPWRRSEISQDQCAEAEELEPRNTKYAGGGERQRESEEPGSTARKREAIPSKRETFKAEDAVSQYVSEPPPPNTPLTNPTSMRKAKSKALDHSLHNRVAKIHVSCTL